jgi:hypothetical protein
VLLSLSHLSVAYPRSAKLATKFCLVSFLNYILSESFEAHKGKRAPVAAGDLSFDVGVLQQGICFELWFILKVILNIHEKALY